MMAKVLVTPIDGVERFLVRGQTGVIAFVPQMVPVNHVPMEVPLHVNAELIANDFSGRLFQEDKRPDFVV